MAAISEHPDRPCGVRLSHLIGLVGVLFDPLIGLAITLPHFFLFRTFLRRLDSPLRRRRGVVFVLGGIEGPSLAQIRVVLGLIRGGWRGAIRVVEWNRGFPIIRPIVNLASRARHERESDRLVDTIRAHRAAHPATTIGLVGQSGGCWVAVRALEKLAGAGEAVDAAVLIAPAISPRHDLRRAASGSRTRLVSVHSPFDWVMLGAGTTILGTADRRWGPAAGLVGWGNAAAGGCMRRELVQALTWQPSWARLGHFGGHCTSAAPGVVAKLLTPLIRAAGSLAVERAGHARLFNRVENDRAGGQSDLVVDAG